MIKVTDNSMFAVRNKCKENFTQNQKALTQKSFEH